MAQEEIRLLTERNFIRQAVGSERSVNNEQAEKKRGGGRSPYEGYETEVWGSSPIQIAAIEKEYRSMEEESFQMGAEDREQNRRKLDYYEFALDFAALPLPRGIITEIARANYATYLDAYKGKAFKAHIICKVLSLEGDAV